MRGQKTASEAVNSTRPPTLWKAITLMLVSIHADL